MKGNATKSVSRSNEVNDRIFVVVGLDDDRDELNASTYERAGR